MQPYSVYCSLYLGGTSLIYTENILVDGFTNRTTSISAFANSTRSARVPSSCALHCGVYIQWMIVDYPRAIHSLPNSCRSCTIPKVIRLCNLIPLANNNDTTYTWNSFDGGDTEPAMEWGGYVRLYIGCGRIEFTFLVYSYYVDVRILLCMCAHTE